MSTPNTPFCASSLQYEAQVLQNALLVSLLKLIKSTTYKF